jgi:hypothetical protein
MDRAVFPVGAVIRIMGGFGIVEAALHEVGIRAVRAFPEEIRATCNCGQISLAKKTPEFLPRRIH